MSCVGVQLARCEAAHILQQPVPAVAVKQCSLAVSRLHMQHIRLLACVVAKNAVGSSWRKTLGTREWSRVPEAEKEAVRQAAAMQLLLGKVQNLGGVMVQKWSNTLQRQISVLGGAHRAPSQAGVVLPTQAAPSAVMHVGEPGV
jgi:hypothetical protein